MNCQNVSAVQSAPDWLPRTILDQKLLCCRPQPHISDLEEFDSSYITAGHPVKAVTISGSSNSASGGSSSLDKSGSGEPIIANAGAPTLALAALGASLMLP